MTQRQRGMDCLPRASDCTAIRDTLAHRGRQPGQAVRPHIRLHSIQSTSAHPGWRGGSGGRRCIPAAKRSARRLTSRAAARPAVLPTPPDSACCPAWGGPATGSPYLTHTSSRQHGLRQACSTQQRPALDAQAILSLQTHRATRTCTSETPATTHLQHLSGCPAYTPSTQDTNQSGHAVLSGNLMQPRESQ